MNGGSKQHLFTAFTSHPATLGNFTPDHCSFISELACHGQRAAQLRRCLLPTSEKSGDIEAMCGAVSRGRVHRDASVCWFDRVASQVLEWDLFWDDDCDGWEGQRLGRFSGRVVHASDSRDDAEGWAHSDISLLGDIESRDLSYKWRDKGTMTGAERQKDFEKWNITLLRAIEVTKAKRVETNSRNEVNSENSDDEASDNPHCHKREKPKDQCDTSNEAISATDRSASTQCKNPQWSLVCLATISS